MWKIIGTDPLGYVRTIQQNLSGIAAATWKSVYEDKGWTNVHIVRDVF